MKLFRLFIVCLVFISCSDSKKDLNVFISDSLSFTVDLDDNYSLIFDQWKDISLISTVKNIKLSDPRQLNYNLYTWLYFLGIINNLIITRAANNNKTNNKQSKQLHNNSI